ncbi:MAG: glycosyltransferase family 4 protein [Deltaproteobacteria bacterium]|jgi:glycosyltransferase involved in cell wall biosynthesis|nr:glycosyltransferase family 4 protein [Deltaproteobacteria bacterium]
MAGAKHMERLAFITPKMSRESGQWLGVQKKIRGQARAFRKLDFEVELFDFAPYGYDANILKDLIRSHAYNRKQYQELIDQVKKYRPDAVYIRYSFSDSHFIFFLKNIKRLYGSEIPIFLEIATFPYDREVRSLTQPGRLYLYVTDLSYRGKLQRCVDYIITYSEYQSIFSIPTIRIENGVDIESIQPAPYNKPSGVYHFIGVSNLVYWTGYERMLHGMADYMKAGNGQKVYFHVVGDGLYLEPLKRLTAEKGLAEQVIFYGAHAGEALDRFFQEKHLAIGNLGVHRKGMVTNPDLKNREYCARAVPFVTSTSDPGFSADFPYILTVPPDESAIQIKQLIDFVENLRVEHPEYQREMREFAEIRFDWAVMLQPVADRMRRRLRTEV